MLTQDPCQHATISLADPSKVWTSEALKERTFDFTIPDMISEEFQSSDTECPVPEYQIIDPDLYEHQDSDSAGPASTPIFEDYMADILTLVDDQLVVDQRAYSGGEIEIGVLALHANGAMAMKTFTL